MAASNVAGGVCDLFELLDELEFECEDEEIANEVADMVVRAIVKAGEFLKLNIPLAGEGKVGKNWCEVH